MGLGVGPDYGYIRETYTGYITTYGDSGRSQTFGRGSTRRWGGRTSVQVLVGYTDAKKFQVNASALEVLEHSYAVGAGPGLELLITRAIFALGADYRPGRVGNKWFVSGGAGCGWARSYSAFGPAVSIGGGRDLGRILQARLSLGYSRYAAHYSPPLAAKAQQLDAALLLAIVRH